MSFLADAPKTIPEVPMFDTEVVTSVARCKEITHQLLREQVLGVAAEGIQLGVHGPLLILQMATCSGKVYVFDLLENREMCDQGRLRSVLESDQVLKVKSRMFSQYELQISCKKCNALMLQHIPIRHSKK